MTQAIFDRFMLLHNKAANRLEREHVRTMAKRVLTAKQYLNLLDNCIEFLYADNAKRVNFKNDFKMFP